MFRHPVHDWVRRSGAVEDVSWSGIAIIRVFPVFAAGSRPRGHDIHGSRESINVEVQTSCSAPEIDKVLMNDFHVNRNHTNLLWGIIFDGNGTARNYLH